MKLKTLEIERYKLESPITLPSAPGRERYIHPLVGDGLVHLNGEHYPIGGRRRIFGRPTHGLLEAGMGEISIEPNGAFDVVVASAYCGEGRTRGPTWIEPKAHEIGEGNHKRTVYEILGGDGPAQRLRFGETFNFRGGWSSWPPHSFDHKPELVSEFEEVFLPFMRPRDGLAILRRKGSFFGGFDVDDALVLRSGEMVSVPLGSHPIVGGPDTELMYVWAYVCPVPKLYSKWAEEVEGYA